MPDVYHIPALILTALLVPAFWLLYLRFRNTRTLLWFLGFVFALLYMLVAYPLGSKSILFNLHPGMVAVALSFLQISSALFLGSMSPLRFRLGRFNILYVVPYAFFLVLYTVLLYGFLGANPPRGPWIAVLAVLGAAILGVALAWNSVKNFVPVWLSFSFCCVLGGMAFWAFVFQGPVKALVFVDSANLIMTALLLFFVYRRLSPGVILGCLGFMVWAAPLVMNSLWIEAHPSLSLFLRSASILAKVVAAAGMIMIVLEDELSRNEAARARECQARRQLEAYSNLIQARRRVEDFDQQGASICETVVTFSRFRQAALLVENNGLYALAGTAGFEKDAVEALHQLALRIQAPTFLAPGSAPAAFNSSQTLQLDLTKSFSAESVARLGSSPVYAVPMKGPLHIEGALLLAGLRPAPGQKSDSWALVPYADDLLPIEMFAAHIQAARSQTLLFEKLIDAEKRTGLGHLADSITQQLNDPLTVILGYSSLLQDSAALDEPDRKGIVSILNEARRVRLTVESLTRLSQARGDLPTMVSVAELLADLDHLYRPEFLHRSIAFHMNIAPRLPRVLCGAQQLRQAIVQCLHYAIGAVERGADAARANSRAIRIEAACEENRLRISIHHSGVGFRHPENAFDPFVADHAEGDAAKLGLSLCATLMHEQNGRATAINLEPRGAAIVLELGMA